MSAAVARVLEKIRLCELALLRTVMADYAPGAPASWHPGGNATIQHGTVVMIGSGGGRLFVDNALTGRRYWIGIGRVIDAMPVRSAA